MSKRLRKPAILLAVAVLAGLLLDRYLLGGADFDQIYRIVLSRVVGTREGELTAVALADVDQEPSAQGNDDRKLLPLPKSLQARLEIQWALKGVSRKRIISVGRVRPLSGDIERFGVKMKAFEKYVDAETGQGVRLFRIDSVRWLGSSEVLVQWSGTHANLDAIGSTMRLKKFLGFWRVVEESHGWIS
jgi:hypothetical protein